jgi:hypothetical protein
MTWRSPLVILLAGFLLLLAVFTGMRATDWTQKQLTRRAVIAQDRQERAKARATLAEPLGLTELKELPEELRAGYVQWLSESRKEAHARLAKPPLARGN